MAGTTFRVALPNWSGPFIMAGAMVIAASRLGHLAECVAAAGRADRPTPIPAARRVNRAVRRAPTGRVVRAG